MSHRPEVRIDVRRRAAGRVMVGAVITGAICAAPVACRDAAHPAGSPGGSAAGTQQGRFPAQDAVGAWPASGNEPPDGALAAFFEPLQQPSGPAAEAPVGRNAARAQRLAALVGEIEVAEAAYLTAKRAHEADFRRVLAAIDAMRSANEGQPGAMSASELIAALPEIDPDLRDRYERTWKLLSTLREEQRRLKAEAEADQTARDADQGPAADGQPASGKRDEGPGERGS